MDWSKAKSFLLGTLFGGLVGALLLPRRRRTEVAARRVGGWGPFAGASCQEAEDGFS